MLWITRSHVHVDRVACPWLITRFIDSDAEFLFVPASQIEQVAKETSAIPFGARTSITVISLNVELATPVITHSVDRRTQTVD